MRAAMRGSYVEYVIFMGVTDMYPAWFSEELYDSTFQDDSRFTFWVPKQERSPVYYEQQLIEEYSVILRAPDGSVHVTTYDAFAELYEVFVYCKYLNSGIAALNVDCMEYVECHEGMLQGGYPDWFDEYFTEVLNFPQQEETVFLSVTGKHVSVTEHCVFMVNRFGEIRAMRYVDFIKYYDPNPELY